ncbi:MAG: glycosyltransferase [bacterium]|nr:glycosyltransferase [bacterium]
MKVLHVLNHSVPWNDGYAIRSKHIVDFQKKIRISPMVVTSPRHEPEISGMCEIFDDIPYYRTVFKNSLLERLQCKLPVFKEYVTISHIEKRIVEIVEKEKVDIIHSHSPIFCGLPAMWVAKRYNIPFVYEARSNWEDSAVEQGKLKRGDARYRVSRYLETTIFKSCDAIITIANELKKEIVSRGISPDRVYYVPNGVDGERFRPMEKDEKIVDQYEIKGKIIVGFIGSFYAFEGLMYLIKAVPKIIKEYSETKFLIVGDGDEMENLKGMVRDLGIDSYVIFTGRVAYVDILRYYSVIDIFVYPRRSERLTELVTPLKPLEAMSMGKAVLGSNVGGIRELVKEWKTGILFKPCDPEDLARRCLELIQNQEKRDMLCNNVRALVLAERSWNKIVEEYEEIYQAIL